MHNKAIIHDKSGRSIHVIFMWLYLKYLLKDTQKINEWLSIGIRGRTEQILCTNGKNNLSYISFLNFLTIWPYYLFKTSYVYIYVYTHTYICIYVCTYILCAYTYIYTQYTYVHIYIHILCTYIHAYIYERHYTKMVESI